MIDQNPTEPFKYARLRYGYIGSQHWFGAQQPGHEVCPPFQINSPAGCAYGSSWE